MLPTRKQGAKGNDAPPEIGESTISLSVPWSSFRNRGRRPHIQGNVQTGTSHNIEVTKRFIQERTRVHEIYIKEESRVKMLGFVISALMFTVSAIILIFAPPDKEALAYALAGVLVIVAAGVAGFSVVRVKALGLSLGQSGSNAGEGSRSRRSVRKS